MFFHNCAGILLQGKKFIFSDLRWLLHLFIFIFEIDPLDSFGYPLKGTKNIPFWIGWWFSSSQGIWTCSLEGDSPEAFDFWGSGQHLWQPHATLRSGALMENTMTCHDGCFFFCLVFLGNDKKGVLKWNCIQRDGLFGLPFFVWNLVRATDVLRCFYVLGRICVHRKFWPDEWICLTAIESAPFYMAGQFQSIVRIRFVPTIVEAYFLSLVLSLEYFDHDCLYLNVLLSKVW